MARIFVVELLDALAEIGLDHLDADPWRRVGSYFIEAASSSTFSLRRSFFRGCRRTIHRSEKCSTVWKKFSLEMSLSVVAATQIRTAGVDVKRS